MRSEERAVSLTRVMITLPPASKSLLYIVVFGFFFGIAVNILQGNTSLVQLAQGAGNGFFLIAVPALLSAVTMSIFKRELMLRRVVFLSFICSVVYALFYLAYALLSPHNLPLVGDGKNLVYISFGIVFCMWIVIAQLVFGLKYSSFVFAAIQLFYNAAFLLANKSIEVGYEPSSLLFKVYFASLAFLAATYVVFAVLNAPMKRAFGVSGVEAIRLFLAQWLKRSKEMEEVFESVGERIITHLGIVVFKTGKKIRALFIVPYVHFGPFGNLGGSEWPEIIGSHVGRRIGAPAFVFHGTATHDFNPVSSSSVKGFIDQAVKAARETRAENASGGLEVGKSGACKAYALDINGNSFIALTRAPKTTEDIDFSLGLAMRNQAKALGAKEVVLVDAHNAETGEIMRVESGNPIGFEFMDAIKNAFGRAKKKAPLKAGFASVQFQEVGKNGGIGGNGLKVAVFSAKGKTFAMLLFDSNGVTPAFRRDLINAAVESGVDACEVMTTDTHAVNTVSGVLNPLGKSEQEKVLEKTRQAIKEAVADLQPFQAGFAVKDMDIEVIGTKSAGELMGTLNAMIAILRIVVPLIILGTVAFILWGITRI